jgi:hypothetical protein
MYFLKCTARPGKRHDGRRKKNNNKTSNHNNSNTSSDKNHATVESAIREWHGDVAVTEEFRRRDRGQEDGWRGLRAARRFWVVRAYVLAGTWYERTRRSVIKTTLGSHTTKDDIWLAHNKRRIRHHRRLILDRSCLLVGIVVSCLFDTAAIKQWNPKRAFHVVSEKESSSTLHTQLNRNNRMRRHQTMT